MKLNKNIGITLFTIASSLIILTNACSKDSGEQIELPELQTFEVSNTTYNKVTCGGSISTNGSAMIIERGICWSTEPTPITTDYSKTDVTDESNDFLIDIEDLASNTTYSVRAYVTNSEGTSYGQEVSFTLWLNAPDEPVTDIDNNSYSTVKIGNQVWMKENLKVTHYKNGDPITNITLHDDSQWLSITSGAYCSYEDDLKNAEKYGYLYNGYAVIDDSAICPEGWHIPSKEEWTILTDYLGGDLTAGNLLKHNNEKEWEYYNLNTNNLSGFSILPAGARIHLFEDNNSLYAYKNRQAYFWIPEENIEYDGTVYMWYSNSQSEVQWARIGNNGDKNAGLSIRCVKD